MLANKEEQVLEEQEKEVPENENAEEGGGQEQAQIASVMSSWMPNATVMQNWKPGICGWLPILTTSASAPKDSTRSWLRWPMPI